MTDGMHVTDLSAGYALGALSDSERDIVESHIRTCAACRNDVEEMQAVARALPLACEPREPRGELAQRIAAAAASEPRASGLLSQQPEPVRVPGIHPAVVRMFATRTPAFVGALATAAAVVMAFVTWNSIRERDALAHRVNDLNGSVAALTQEVNTIKSANGFLRAQTAHDRAVLAAWANGTFWTAGPALDQHGAMWRYAIVQPPSGHNAMLLASLPDPPKGMGYEVWVKRAGAMHKAGMVMHGGMSMVDMRMPVQHGDLIAFSVEPMRGSEAPTSTLVMESVL